MLEKPDIADERITACVGEQYGVQIDALTFLPLGADVNTAVYRAAAGDGSTYFLKLRKGSFDELSAAVPQFLHALQIQPIIVPLATRTAHPRDSRPWAEMDEYKLILYPFVEGKDGYEQALTADQWRVFGKAMRGVHEAKLPPVLAERIGREDFSARGRVLVRKFQKQAQGAHFVDAVAEKLAAFMRAHDAEILRLVERADALAGMLHERDLEFVLCHNDLHPGNILIAGDGRIFIVDWDNPLFAPKERDLCLIGGEGRGPWRSRSEAEAFYQGYGVTRIDIPALAYYRCERIIQDITEFCKALLLTGEGGEDREQSYRYFVGQFQPGMDVEIALKTGE